MKIAPSILGIEAGKLQEELGTIDICDRVHIDVMDGNYVEARSFMEEELDTLTFNTATEVHLMVDNPEQYFDRFQDLGCEGITFHIENTGNDRALELIDDIKDRGLKAGICIDGYTEVSAVNEAVLEAVDQVLLMSVKAGAGGQSFMPEVLDKIRAIRDRGFKGEIEVDGGVSLENAASLKEAGADIVVVGSALMKRTEPGDRPQYIKDVQAI